MITAPRKEIFTTDFAMENAWQRSFKRMKKEIAASEGDRQTELAGDPELEDAEERNREWEMAKLQEEIRQAKKEIARRKEEQEGSFEGNAKASQQK